MTVTPIITNFDEGRIYEWTLTTTDPNGEPVLVHQYDTVIITYEWHINGLGSQDALDHSFDEAFSSAFIPANSAPLAKPYQLATAGSVYSFLDLTKSLPWVRPRLQNYSSSLPGSYVIYRFHCYF